MTCAQVGAGGRPQRRSCIIAAGRQLRVGELVDAGLLDVVGDRRPGRHDRASTGSSFASLRSVSSAGLTSTRPATSSGRVLGQPQGQRAAHRQAGDEDRGRTRPRSVVEGRARPRRTSRPSGCWCCSPASGCRGPGSRGQRDGEALGRRGARPTAACSCGVPVKPWHEQHAGAAVAGRRRRRRRTARRRACTSARAVGPARGSSRGVRRAVPAGAAYVAWSHAAAADCASAARSLVWQLHEGGVLFYWFLKWVALGPLLQLVFRPARRGRRERPRRGPGDPGEQPPVVRRLALHAARRCRGGSPSWPRPSTSPARASRAGSRRSSSPAPARCRSTGPAPRPPRARCRPAKRILGEGELFGIYPEGTRSPRRPALPRQDRRGPAGAGDQGAGDPGRGGRHRRRRPARQEVRHVHPAGRALRQAAGLLPLRGHGERPLHPALDHRRDHVRDHAALRPGVRRHLRRAR